jgi:hypothetical protein
VRRRIEALKSPEVKNSKRNIRSDVTTMMKSIRFEG